MIIRVTYSESVIWEDKEQRRQPVYQDFRPIGSNNLVYERKQPDLSVWHKTNI